MSPQVGGWIAHSLRRLHGTSVGPPLRFDLGHLSAVSLAACARAGVDAELEVPVREGAVPLPTLGMARVGRADSGGFSTAVARLCGPVLQLGYAGTSVEVRPLSQADSPRWESLRTLSAGAGADGPPWVWLEDLDPYRDLDEPIPPRRLDRTEVGRWQGLLTGAVALLSAPTTQPGGLDIGHVSCIVPLNSVTGLRTAPTGPGVSASTGDAFGSMIISPPRDATALAETMVHEFQHSKLGALLHLFPLLEDSGSEEFYSPWRPDPRHLTGLLHGAYAFTGVAGFWREQFSRAATDTAAFHFALRRLQARLVVHTLLTRGQLTPIGLRLVRRLAGTLDSWLREYVPANVRVRAREAAMNHRVEWRLRNLRCRAEEQSALARGFLRGAPPVPGSRFAPVLGVEPALAFLTQERNPRDLDAVRAVGPVGRSDGSPSPGSPPPMRGASLAAARTDTALPGTAPPDPRALAGWLLAAAEARPAYRQLLRRPERLAALLEATGAEPTTDDLCRMADWLSRP